MNAWNLTWVIPLAASFGYAAAVLMMACKKREERWERGEDQ